MVDFAPPPHPPVLLAKLRLCSSTHSSQTPSNFALLFKKQTKNCTDMKRKVQFFICVYADYMSQFESPHLTEAKFKCIYILMQLENMA
jgi:hypothetical protein